MKRVKNIATKALTVILAVCMAFGVCAVFVGCNAKFRVTVRLANPSIAVGGTTTAVVAIAGTDDQEYTLGSENEAVATVDADGVIKGVAAGTVKIVATAHADGKSKGSATLVVGGGGGTGVMPDEVVIKATVAAGESDRLSSVGETTRITATVTGADDPTYKFAVDNEYKDYIKVAADGTVTVLRLPEKYDVFAKVTVTSNADPRKTAVVSIRIEAPYIAGRVGDLTSAMIEAISDPSITISGTITDIYDDMSIDANDYEHIYNTKVEMQSGKWKCEWSIGNPEAGAENNALTLMYVANDDSISIRPEEGLITNAGKTISNVYIDKDNKVKRETVTNFMGTPMLWENQCMYNLFKEYLPIRDFEQADSDEYPNRMYHLKSSAVDDLIMVRLAASMSAVFTNSDIFSGFYFVLNEEKTTIEKIVANTARSYNTGDATTATAQWWTETELTLSAVGTTNVSDPTPYAETEHTQELAAALAAMKGLDSYFYAAVDTTTQAPSGDPGDYEVSGYMSASAKAAGARADSRDVIWGNRTINAGTVGQKGWVTAEGVLNERVSKYTNTMDDNDTKYEYSGFRNFPDASEPANSYYEKFDWVYATAASEGKPAVPSHFRGVQHIEGNMSDVLPGFDFSANVFKYVGESGKGKTFRLQSDDIYDDVAQEVSMYSYATDAEASTSRSFTITIKDGKVVETVYPYNINDNYFGYVTTTYSRFDETQLPMLKRDNNSDPVDLFDGYAPRIIPTSWTQMLTKYYYPNHSTTGNRVTADAETAMKASYGEAKFTSIPTPDRLLFNVFGDIFDATTWEDGFSGPFFDWADKSGGGYYDVYTFKCKIETEGNYPSTAEWDKIKTDVGAVLTAANYSLNPAQTGKTSMYEGVGSRFITFKHESTGMVIQIENNYTKYLDIYIFEEGAYTRTITH